MNEKLKTQIELPDVNQVRIRGTVASFYKSITKVGQERLILNVLMRSEYIDAFGDKNYSKQFVSCIVWGTAAHSLEAQIKQGSIVQVIGEINSYAQIDPANPAKKIYKTEIRTIRTEVVGFNEQFIKTQAVEFAMRDDFSDL